MTTLFLRAVSLLVRHLFPTQHGGEVTGQFLGAGGGAADAPGTAVGVNEQGGVALHRQRLAAPESGVCPLVGSGVLRGGEGLLRIEAQVTGHPGEHLRVVEVAGR